MTRPEGMTAEQAARSEKFDDRPTDAYPLGRRTAFLERASIVHEACPGVTWAEAYELAFAEFGFPTQKELVR